MQSIFYLIITFFIINTTCIGMMEEDIFNKEEESVSNTSANSFTIKFHDKQDNPIPSSNSGAITLKTNEKEEEKLEINLIKIKDSNITSSTSSPILSFYDAQLQQVNRVSDQSTQVSRAAQSLLTLNTMQAQQDVKKTQIDITKTLSGINFKVDDIKKQNEKLKIPEKKLLNVAVWASERLNGERVDLVAGGLQEKFHRYYSLGGVHTFPVPYNGSLPYKGYVRCGKSYTFSTCDNNVQYSGSGDYNGSVNASCRKDHHKCLCSEIRDLCLELQNTNTAYEELKKDYYTAKELIDNLLAVNSSVNNMAEEVDDLAEQVMQPLVQYDLLSDKVKDFINLASMASHVQSSMVQSREKFTQMVQEENEKRSILLTEMKEESKMREEALKKEISQERSKIDEMSKKFINDLDERHKGFFQKIEDQRNALISKYESKLDELSSEKKKADAEYKISNNKLIEIESMTKHSKTTLFQVLQKLAKKNNSSSEFSNKLLDFKKEIKNKTFQELLNLFEEYLLDE